MIIFIIWLLLAQERLGIDLFPNYDQSFFNWLASNGYSYAIPRGYRSNNQVDANACSTLNKAK